MFFGKKLENRKLAWKPTFLGFVSHVLYNFIASIILKRLKPLNALSKRESDSTSIRVLKLPFLFSKTESSQRFAIFPRFFFRPIFREVFEPFSILFGSSEKLHTYTYYFHSSFPLLKKGEKFDLNTARGSHGKQTY